MATPTLTGTAKNPIEGTDGNDTIFGTDNDDTIKGDAGNDFIFGGNGDDLIYGGEGDDTLYGGDGDDTIVGGDGDDLVVAGNGTDYVYGGDGDDTIVGGGDNDSLSGGDGDDSFIVNSIGTSGATATTVAGGDGTDTLDFSSLIDSGYDIETFVKNESDTEAGSYSGQITLYNSDDNTWVNINYTSIEYFVPCFTPGAMVATPRGLIAAEQLRAGDLVLTRDNGAREIAWAGRCELGCGDLLARPELAPVRIAAGALGPGLPERDIVVSPNHRMLLSGEAEQLYFAEHEVLVAAKHLVGRPGVSTLGLNRPVSYVHFMFDAHELVLVDGAWSESFQPGDVTLAGMGQAQRAEIYALFPELATHRGRQDYVAARKTLKRHEALLLH